VFPFIVSTVQAGFPSPAGDYIIETLDLRDYVVSNDTATYFVRAAGSSMNGAGIDNGDLLVVDRSVRPCDGCIAICIIEGEYTVKRIRQIANAVWLVPENPDFKPIPVDPETGVIVWGVVTFIVKKVEHR
jgi:DNA polymerase V